MEPSNLILGPTLPLETLFKRLKIWCPWRVSSHPCLPGASSDSGVYRAEQGRDLWGEDPRPQRRGRSASWRHLLVTGWRCSRFCEPADTWEPKQVVGKQLCQSIDAARPGVEGVLEEMRVRGGGWHGRGIWRWKGGRGGAGPPRMRWPLPAALLSAWPGGCMLTSLLPLFSSSIENYCFSILKNN